MTTHSASKAGLFGKSVLSSPKWIVIACACLLLPGCSAQQSHTASMAMLIVLAHIWLCLIAFLMPPGWSRRSRVIGALLAVGVAAFLVFWAYFFAPAVGRIFSIATLLAPAVAAAWIWRARVAPREDLVGMHSLALPSLVLTGLTLWIGLYPFAWEGTDWTVPALRWRDMPSDNWLSFMVGEMMARGVIVSPMLEQWLTSDRPPLQSGLFLIFRDLVVDHEGLVYQTVSSWAQSLILLPLAMLIADTNQRALRGWMLAVIGLSALVVFNTLFVWPKLLAATYCIIYHLLLFDRQRQRVVSRWPWFDSAAGCAAALALLSHGGSAFALFGSTIAYLLMHWKMSIPSVFRIAAVSLGTYLPWLLYQKLVDPPGDRLVKWHFAGQIDVTPDSTGRVLVDAYSRIPLSTWIDGRQANIDIIFAEAVRFFSDAARLFGSFAGGGHRHLVEPMIEASFFSTAYGLWFFSPLLILPFLACALLTKTSLRSTWPPGLLLATPVSLLVWIVLMFMPASTTVHVGAYFTTIALQLIVMLLVAAVSRPVFGLLAVSNIALFLPLYAFDRPQSAMQMPMLYATGAVLLTVAFIAACCLARPAWFPVALSKDSP